MPFFDDSGPRPEEERSAIWRAFALLRDQLERMILLNLAWMLLALPLLLALAFPELPSWLRLGLALGSAAALAPGAAALFAALDQTSTGLPLDLALAIESLKTHWRSGWLTLLPLYSLFYWLYLAAAYAESAGWLLPDTLARLGLLLLAVLSIYWGPLAARFPQLNAGQVLLRSLRLFWRFPGPTLLTGLACLLALALGIISIGGLFLIAPVLAALFQVQHLRQLPGAAQSP